MKKHRFITAICLIMALASSCGGGRAEMEPEAVVVEFYTSLTSMKFEKAEKLCVEGSQVLAYISEYRQLYEESLKRDEKVTNIAAEKVAGSTVTITETLKDKDNRTVSFVISDTYGNTKEKEATLQKIEKGWKIAELKDKQ